MIFAKKDGVFHKQVLASEHINFLLQENANTVQTFEGAIRIAKGIRTYKTIYLDDEFIQNLKAVLTDYLGEIEVNSECRFYEHTYGEVIRHQDFLGDYTHTLLVYMNEDFIGGKLHVKSNKTVFRFTPRIGWGICFWKDLIHWADCVEEGSKKFVLIDLKSL